MEGVDLEHNYGMVVLSGGQDSTTCLGVAMKKCERVRAVSYDYGQKHKVELKSAYELCYKYKIPLDIINLEPVLSNMKSSALITHTDTALPHAYLTNLPASFVPARNALFLTIAYGLAMEHGCDVIFAGMCQTDYSGYPDCRDAFIKALNASLNLGYESFIPIETPLMWLNKAETFMLAETVGVMDDVLRISATCYEGDTDTWHDWGFGCGNCPACKLRAKGWEEYKKLIAAQASNMPPHTGDIGA